VTTVSEDDIDAILGEVYSRASADPAVAARYQYDAIGFCVVHEPMVRRAGLEKKR
jgi:hypothetical protein